MRTLLIVLVATVVATLYSCKEKYNDPQTAEPKPPEPVDTLKLIPGEYQGSYTSFDTATGNGPNYGLSDVEPATVYITWMEKDSLVFVKDGYDWRCVKLKDGRGYGFEWSPVDYQKIYIKGDSLYLYESHFDFRGNNSWRRIWGGTGRWKKAK